MRLMYKITEEKHRQELDYLPDTFKNKNHDYSNSSETSLNSFGFVAGMVS